MKYTTEQLLELVEKNDAQVLPNLDCSIDLVEFISIYKITAGEELIATSLLYELYKAWSKEPITKETFCLHIYRIFPYKRIRGDYRGLFLNKNIVDLLKILYKKKPKDPTKVKSYRLHFEKFIKEHEIIKGTFYFNEFPLYNIYTKWTKHKRKKVLLGQGQFCNIAKLYFKHKVKNGLNFAINHSVVKHLTEEMKMNYNIKRKTKNETSEKKTN